VFAYRGPSLLFGSTISYGRMLRIRASYPRKALNKGIPRFLRG
jgi:hypothetical protein